MSRDRFEGKAGIVTGAGSGLGREVALALAEEGAEVVALDLSEQSAGETAAAAGDLLGGVVARHGDVTREDDIISAIADCRERFGKLDFIHNNAGLQVEAPLHETTNEQWDALTDVNLKGIFWGCKHAVIAMREDGGGSIVNTASVLAITADAVLPAYTATKTGILGLTRAIALGYAADNIRCNAVCPGDMDTPMVQQYLAASGDPEGTLNDIESAYPGNRISQPREVAMAVLFLLSDEASFVNGATMVADGAVTVRTY